MARVFVTGLGYICSIGNDQETVVHNLRNLKHGMALYPPVNVPDSPVKVVAPVKEFGVDSLDQEDWTYPARYKIRRQTIRSFSPHVLYAYCSFLQAIENADLEEMDVSNKETGIYTASGGSIRFIYHHLRRMEKRGVMRCNPLNIISSVAGTLSFNLVSHFKIQGASTGFASACASSGHAMGFAFDEIRLGRQKRMFVVGAEDCNFESVVPFCGMRALSLSRNPARASRPFDQTRDGFVSSGGAVTVVLESEEEVERRGVPVYGEMVSWGQASDGYNVAISHPEGRGLESAMLRALEDAGIQPARIGYINAHAPSTPIGDRSEVLAVRRVFDPEEARPMISSTKALTGHGLSLSSVLEAALCMSALRHGFVPGSAHIRQLMSEAEGLNIIRQTVNATPAYILSNSSGFGGANTSLLFKACQK